jgi:hypothetical protein
MMKITIIIIIIIHVTPPSFQLYSAL